MAKKKESGETTITDPNKAAMLSPGDGDAADALEIDAADDLTETPEPTDTETETDKEPTDTDVAEASDTATETAGKEDPDIALLRQHELDKTYGSVPAALSAAREQQRYIDQQRQELRDLHAAVQRLSELRREPTPAGPTQDELAEMFATNPQAALAQMGVVDRSQITPIVQNMNALQERLDHQAFLDALSQYDELRDVATHFRTRGGPPPRGTNKLWDIMDERFAESPYLRGAKQADVISLLYDAAKTQVASNPKVPPVPSERKISAQTTGSGRATKPKPSGIPDFKKMELPELEKWLREHGAMD